MLATFYDIQSKRGELPVGLANIHDFELRERGQIDCAVILQNPNISLYSLDFNQQQAVFVETLPEADLSQAPFYYLAQYQQAIQVFTVSFTDLIYLAQSIPVDDKRLVFIHSVGRAGSTLASQVFAQVKGVMNFSEPDALTILVAVRSYQPDQAIQLKALLQATVRILCKTPAPTAWVIKGRSFVIELGDWLHQLYPGAKHLFLYRDAETWLQSALGAYGSQLAGAEEIRYQENQLRQSFAPLVPLIAAYDKNQHLSSVGLLTLMWLSGMEQYMRLHRMGVEMLAIPYASWQLAPEATALAMLNYCNVAAPDSTQLQQSLAKDSQAGTFLSQATVQQKNICMQASDLKELHRYVQQHALISTVDFQVPNTLDLTSGS